MKTIILTLILIITPFFNIINAQYGWDDLEDMRFGFRLGIGASNLSGLSITDELSGIPISFDYYTVNYKPSWDIGIVFQNTFRNNVFVQSEAIYSLVGAKLKDKNSSNTQNINIHYMGVNAYFGKKAPIKYHENNKIIAAIGVYGSFDVSEDIFDVTISEFETFDLGLAAMLGVELNKMQLSVNYLHGMTNVATDGSVMRNRAIRLGIAYLF